MTHKMWIKVMLSFPGSTKKVSNQPSTLLCFSVCQLGIEWWLSMEKGQLWPPPLQGTSDNVWRHFWLLQEGDGGTGSCATGIYRVEAQDTAKHLLKMHHCLCCVFIAMRGLSLAVASGGHSLVVVTGFSSWWLLLLQSRGSRVRGLQLLWCKRA